MLPILRRLAAIVTTIAAVLVIGAILVLALPASEASSEVEVVRCGAIRASGAITAEFSCDDGACSKTRTECKEALKNVVSVCSSSQGSVVQASGEGEGELEKVSVGRTVSSAAVDVGKKDSIISDGQVGASADVFAECLREASPMVIKARNPRSRKLPAALAFLFLSGAQAGAIPKQGAGNVVKECALPKPEAVSTPEEVKKAVKDMKECLDSSSLSPVGNNAELSWLWHNLGYPNSGHYGGDSYTGLASQPTEGGALLLSAAAVLVALCSLVASLPRHLSRSVRDAPGTELVAVAVAV